MKELPFYVRDVFTQGEKRYIVYTDAHSGVESMRSAVFVTWAKSKTTADKICAILNKRSKQYASPACNKTEREFDALVAKL